jgi:hypothetical protein
MACALPALPRCTLLSHVSHWFNHAVPCLHCNENPIYVIPEKVLHGLSPNFHIHVSVSNLYIPRMTRLAFHDGSDLATFLCILSFDKIPLLKTASNPFSFTPMPIRCLLKSTCLSAGGVLSGHFNLFQILCHLHILAFYSRLYFYCFE